MTDSAEFLTALKDYANSEDSTWATQETAKEIEKHIKLLAVKFKATDSKKLNDAGDNLIDSASELSSSAKSIGKHQSKMGQATAELEKAFGMSGTRFGKMTKGLDGFKGNIGKATGLFTKLNPLTMGISVGFMALTAVISSTIDFFVNSLQAIGQLREVGVTFAGGLMELRHAAQMSSLSFEDFVVSVRNNSKTINALAKGNRSGIKVFAELSRVVRDDVSNSFGMLGMTSEEVTEHMVNYLESQRTLGLLEGMTNSERKNAAVEYIGEMSKLSSILGRSRKEIAASTNEQMMGAINFRAYLRTIPEDQRKIQAASMRSVTGLFQAIDAPEFTDVMYDMVAQGFSNTDFGIAIQTMGGDVAKEMQTMVSQIKRGANPKELEQTFFRFTKAAETSGRSIDEMARFYPEFADVFKAMDKARRVDEEAAKARRAAAIEQGKIEKLWQDLRITFTDLNKAFAGIKLSMMGSLKPVLDDVAKYLNDRVMPAIKSMASNINKIFGKEGDFSDKISAALSEIGNTIGPMISPIFEELGTWIKDAILRSMNIETDAMEQRRKFREERAKIQAGQELTPQRFKELVKDLMIDVRDGDVSKSEARKMVNELKRVATAQMEASSDASDMAKMRAQENIDQTLKQYDQSMSIKRYNHAARRGSRIYYKADHTYEDVMQPKPKPFATGGRGEFGTGTPAMLHGLEHILTKDQMDQLISASQPDFSKMFDSLLPRLQPASVTTSKVVDVKIDPIDLESLMTSVESGTNSDPQLPTLISRVEELIDINKAGVGATYDQTRRVSREIKKTTPIDDSYHV